MELKMDNVFAEKKKHSQFSWEYLGNIQEGRGELGEEMPVLVYRLMQYSMLDVLSKEYGEDRANDFFRAAGFLAGGEYARNVLDLTVDENTFIASLQRSLKEHRIGILRMEMSDPETGNMVLAVGEDLDCSGLPVTHENVCVYDEGFIAGILNAFTKKTYDVREVDCWASGGRSCRFEVNVVD